jgi:hypothetical protein
VSVSIGAQRGARTSDPHRISKQRGRIEPATHTEFQIDMEESNQRPTQNFKSNYKMPDIEKRLDKLEGYQDRIVASIKELNNINQELKEKLEKMEEENEKLKTLLNANGTNIIMEQAKRENAMKKINENIEKLAFERPLPNNERSEKIEMPMPLFFGNQRDIHPKKYLIEIEKYLKLKKIEGDDQIIIIENSLRNKASSWYAMMKFASPTLEVLKGLFLKQYFSENHQWEMFIQCTEAGKKTIQYGYQEHFHHWMTELKYLDMPRLEEEQAINLIMKHFPISVPAYIQNCTEKMFIPIWEKLGEVEPKVRTENIRTENNRNGIFRTENRYDKNEKTDRKGVENRRNEKPEKRMNQIAVVKDGSDEENISDDESKNEEWGFAEPEARQC